MGGREGRGGSYGLAQARCVCVCVRARVWVAELHGGRRRCLGRDGLGLRWGLWRVRVAERDCGEGGEALLSVAELHAGGSASAVMDLSRPR